MQVGIQRKEKVKRESRAEEISPGEGEKIYRGVWNLGEFSQIIWLKVGIATESIGLP